MQSNKLPPTEDPRCGTYAGYKNHKNKNEHPCIECRKASTAYHKQYRLLNIEKARATDRKYYASTPEKQKKRRKKYYLERQDEQSLKRQRRRALKHNAPSEPYVVQEILDTYGTNCHICKLPIDLSAPRRIGEKGWEQGLHLEHLVPLFKGGSDLVENIRPSHGICNVKKGAKTP